MREKELRLALVCYGGISLAVYMHGVTKEIWRLARASRAQHDGASPSEGVEAVYRELLALIESRTDARLRVMADIIAGASAGGINGIFLARAITTGESLDPLTDLWLERADVEVLLDPDARPLSRFTKFWAVPIAWLVMRTRRNAIDSTVERGARPEVRRKLSNFVRARWFAPPFGGEVFSGLLLDAFDAMAAGPKGEPLVPPGQPVDLMVTVTDFAGYAEVMRLNSPAQVKETEHRLIFAFRHAPGRAHDMADVSGLTFAARATASFPGAFPAFTATELDAVLKQRGRAWPQRETFLARQLSADMPGEAQHRILVDGSVLANAPFRPAMAALRERPARREVDRRFVYIDPKPGRRAISLGRRGVNPDGSPELPGFFGAILKTMSDIPRAQPIRDNVEALEAMSQRIRRMRHIITAMQPEVEARIEAALGYSFFLDSPTAARLAGWRATAQARARQEAGYGYVAYDHLKLSLIVEELARVVSDVLGLTDDGARLHWRNRLWDEVRAGGLDRIGSGKGGENEALIAFLRGHDLGFRIRRLRHLVRRLDEVAGSDQGVPPDASEAMRNAIYEALGPYLDRESRDFYSGLLATDVDAPQPGQLIERVAARRALMMVDQAADERIAEGLAQLPKAARRAMLHSYLGFPFFDAATLPLLQGEGQGEFDPIKIDRISPDDAGAIRKGGAEATLKGIQFNAFGAFFSRTFRENDYLWGRLHAAERLIDIAASTAPEGRGLDAGEVERLRKAAFLAILEEEAPRLTTVTDLIAELRAQLNNSEVTAATGTN
ncbi:patatin-like protein [Sphingomonas lacunae]|uniref:Patatin-like protein n=1 Tax=Sphingomonas lacunae TaxID=2698828 RepID=A0A6M4AY32_9SPHN|nr:patatin-like protein [Sphingomonas lacunae]QJQ33270.1 patatin-like protein [Sphingomonas lacunae]